MKWEIGKSLISDGDFCSPLSEIDIITSQEIFKDLEEQDNNKSQKNLIDIYRTFHSTTEYTFFSSTCETVIKLDYILGHITILNTFKRIGII